MHVNRLFIRTALLASIMSILAPGPALAIDAELRGKPKSTVEQRYGKPLSVVGPVGDPPITKWQYTDFSVVFEHDHVIHAYKREFELEKRPTPPRQQSQAGGDTLDVPTPQPLSHAPDEPLSGGGDVLDDDSPAVE